ncbi:16116_t:CDS:2 [Entrophospora sp. SA101]|nr:16116_t:CDS:2 [Entrophospora sp. SA101]
MEKNVDDEEEEEIISMSNFNEENQDEEDIEETSPISSQDALLAIEKYNFLYWILSIIITDKFPGTGLNDPSVRDSVDYYNSVTYKLPKSLVKTVYHINPFSPPHFTRENY